MNFENRERATAFRQGFFAFGKTALSPLPALIRSYASIRRITIEKQHKIQQLLDIMAQLRDPVSGCPWDREQDFSTIAPYTIEEAYEVADAIQHGRMDELKDELGDLLFQVVFHARMAEEQQCVRLQ